MSALEEADREGGDGVGGEGGRENSDNRAELY